MKLPPKLPPEPKWEDVFPVTKGPRAAENRRCRAQARWFWRLYIDNMGPIGVVSLLDDVILRRAAINFARLDAAERETSIEGMTHKTDYGTVKHPATTVVNLLDARLIQQMRDLGMTPLARERLRPPGEESDDESDFDPTAHPPVGDHAAGGASRA